MPPIKQSYLKSLTSYRFPYDPICSTHSTKTDSTVVNAETGCINFCLRRIPWKSVWEYCWWIILKILRRLCIVDRYCIFYCAWLRLILSIFIVTGFFTSCTIGWFIRLRLRYDLSWCLVCLIWYYCSDLKDYSSSMFLPDRYQSTANLLT